MATPKPFSDKWWVVVSALMPSRVAAVDYDHAQRIADNFKRRWPNAVIYVEHVKTYHSEPVDTASGSPKG